MLHLHQKLTGSVSLRRLKKSSRSLQKNPIAQDGSILLAVSLRGVLQW